MDYKHNFRQCNILTRETPPPKCNICYIFFKTSLTHIQENKACETNKEKIIEAQVSNYMMCNNEIIRENKLENVLKH